MLWSPVTIPRPLIRYEKGLAPITTVDGSTYWPLGRWEGKICAQVNDPMTNWMDWFRVVLIVYRSVHVARHNDH